mgnify:CR=1 FL=1
MTGVIYARYSCDKQTENSILGQFRECSNLAKQNNIDIINIYKDEAISGRTDNRPAFKKMISDAKLKLFDCIIVWKGDRFSRSRADAAKYKTELKQIGIKVLSATEANCTGPEAILMDGINEAFAEYFSVELAAKVDRGMTQNAIDGKFNGGRIPVGFKKENDKIVIDEEKAWFVKEIFKRVANDSLSIKEIYHWALEKGFTNTNDEKMKRTTFYNMLTQKKYTGYYDYKGQVNTSIFPQIIDQELFNKVQSKLKNNKVRPATYKAKVKYLLSGKLFCAKCGSPFTGSYAKSHTGDLHYYYRCSGRIHGCDVKYLPKDEIENIVLQLIFEEIFTKEKIDLYIQRLIEYSKQKNPILPSLQKNLNLIRSKKNNLINFIENHGDDEGLYERLQELKKQEIELEKQIKENKITDSTFSEENVRSFLGSLKLRNYLDDNNKKFLIENLIDSIYIEEKENKLNIYYKNGNVSEIDQGANKILNGSPKAINRTNSLC